MLLGIRLRLGAFRSKITPFAELFRFNLPPDLQERFQ
jgi:hypothetical protein